MWRGWPGPSPGEGGWGGYHPPGAAAAGAWAFSGESPDERAPWGAAPWTPARRRRVLPRGPLLWLVQTLRGRFYRLGLACGPHSARLPMGAVLRAAGVGGWYPSGGDDRRKAFPLWSGPTIEKTAQKNIKDSISLYFFRASILAVFLNLKKSKFLNPYRQMRKSTKSGPNPP